MSNLTPTGGKRRSFWERPEGTTGMVVSALAVLAAGWGVYHLLPVLITLFQNLIVASLLAVALVILAWVISQRKVWKTGAFMFQSAMRAITKAFVEIDPIGVMRTYVERLGKLVSKMEGEIAKVRGVIQFLRRKIEEANAEKDRAWGIAAQAKKEGNEPMFNLKGREAQRREKRVVKFSEMLTKLEVIYRILLKYREGASIRMLDITDQVEDLEVESKAMRAAGSAMRSAMSVINGDPDEMAMFDMGVEATVEQIAAEYGEIETFLDMSKGFIEGIDLENGYLDAQALRRFEEWEKKADNLLLGPSKQVLIDSSSDPSQRLDLTGRPELVPVVRPATSGKSGRRLSDLVQ